MEVVLQKLVPLRQRRRDTAAEREETRGAVPVPRRGLRLGLDKLLLRFLLFLRAVERLCQGVGNHGECAVGDDQRRPRARLETVLVQRADPHAAKKWGVEAGTTMGAHWLMKSEPEPRVVQGVDVSFSAETFEKAQVTSWEGVRNYQARQFLRDEMKVGHEVLFYHSNTKLPGIAALAEVCRDGYPDPTAWDSKHPYYDAKATDKANPRWFRVDVRFVRRLPYFVPLALLQHIAQGLSAEQRKDVAYLSDEHLAGIAGMALLNRSRLSVQVRCATHSARPDERLRGRVPPRRPRQLFYMARQVERGRSKAAPRRS